MGEITMRQDRKKAMEYLRFLDDNWDSYGAKCPTSATLDAVEALLLTIRSDFTINPLSDGSVCVSFLGDSDKVIQVTFEEIDKEDSDFTE